MMRKDLQDLIDRKSYLLDKNRVASVQKRHGKGARTTRENIADICDDGSFLEIGSLTVAAQRGRKTEKELIEQTPADGLIVGLAKVNSHFFGASNSNCIILGYDYTVLAGTQGAFNHKKTDRVIQMAKETGYPIIFFVEGGGGRPGDVDADLLNSGGLDIATFVEYARLSGKQPRVAIVSGYCFAGNAAIAGCSDVIIATKNVSLGMGGPAMIEGGGLGIYHPNDIGTANTQFENGVVDILVKDEADAVDKAKQYLSYFQGALDHWTCPDQSVLRSLIPENRKFAYDIFKVIKQLSDIDSVLELRGGFAKNMITAMIRIEGKAFGLIANSTRHLGGAIDSDAADKAARFMQLCDAFGVPMISLCDAPGFMVGPDCEQTAMVRHSSRMFITGASINVPIITIVLRKAYGLGAMAMAGGSLHESILTLSWPTGEFGPMGLEGAAKLGFKKEIEAENDPDKKEKLYQSIVDHMYERGKALRAASYLEFDEVIDPMETRNYVLSFMKFHTNKPSRKVIDAW